MYYTGAFTNLNYPKQLLRLYFLMTKVDQAYFVIYLTGSIYFKHFSFDSYEKWEIILNVQ